MADIKINQVSGSIAGLASLCVSAMLVASPTGIVPERILAGHPVIHGSSSTFGAGGKQSNIFPDLPAYEEVAEAVTGLGGLIKAARSAATIDEDCITIADAAAADALSLVQRIDLPGSPQVSFSEDGILGLQWQRGEHGAALIFAGDGIVSIAFRRPGVYYAENGIEISISDELPAQFTEALTAILS